LLVYGDEQEALCPRAALSEIEAALQGLCALPRGLSWHASAVEAFILFAALVQGFADSEMGVRGYDETSSEQQQLYGALLKFARRIDRSWTTKFHDQTPPSALELSHLYDLPWPVTITSKRSEGYAFYSLYPETYLEAARSLSTDSVVIGLRSIGTGLAALVAAAAGSQTIFTLRPTGHPFSRSVDAGPELCATIKSLSDCHFVIVDEGPGLSGSSFGGVADWLEAQGVSPDRIIFMPSHVGDLGPNASQRHRVRWESADKRVITFEQIFTSTDACLPLHKWFRDITGTLLEPPRNLSGGDWADGRTEIATAPSREARKYLFQGSRGSFLAKFAGLDRASQAKLQRASALHEAGFSPEPRALRYGFLLERYCDGDPATIVPIAHVADYCSFRQRHFPGHAGSTLMQLLKMATYNLGQVDQELPTLLAARWPEHRVRSLQPLVEPVHVDGRLQNWEWLCCDGRILKTDAVDHSQGHDLVGCQDILWDVAGAAVELPHIEEQEADLASRFCKSPGRRELLQYLKLCYAAFQLGWWSLSDAAGGQARSHLYTRRAVAMLAA
jgi:hypothetical protein